MPYLITDDQRQIYFEHHLGQGAQRRLPVLLLHGWGMSTRVWDTTVPALLAAGHSVVAFDQRGCGQSDKDFRENTIAASARDAVALLKHLGIGKVVVNGWSLGGAVAVDAAGLLGANCAAVVLTAGGRFPLRTAGGHCYADSGRAAARPRHLPRRALQGGLRQARVDRDAGVALVHRHANRASGGCGAGRAGPGGAACGAGGAGGAVVVDRRRPRCGGGARDRSSGGSVRSSWHRGGVRRLWPRTVPRGWPPLPPSPARFP